MCVNNVIKVKSTHFVSSILNEIVSPVEEVLTVGDPNKMKIYEMKQLLWTHKAIQYRITN